MISMRVMPAMELSVRYGLKAHSAMLDLKRMMAPALRIGFAIVPAPLVPPVSPACISSPFGPRLLVNHPRAGTYNYGVDLPSPPGASVVATAPGKVLAICSILKRTNLPCDTPPT